MRILTGGFILLAADRASATIIYSGVTYTENFDSLPASPENTSLEALGTPQAWADDTTSSTNVISIPGWYLWHANDPGVAENGTNAHQRFRIQSGQSGTGSFYSFGGGTNVSVNPNSDRALGDVGSTTIANNPPNDQNVITALRLTNNTGIALTEFDVTYTGEQWRNNGNANTDTIFFSYSLDPAATVNSGTYTGVSALDFVSPIHTATAAATDGNAPANRQTLNASVTGILWQPGADLWLRWNDLQIGGNDHALGIDDVSFTATPEPSSLALVGIGAASLLARRRRQ
jgi:hypothetical protein